MRRELSWWCARAAVPGTRRRSGVRSRSQSGSGRAIPRTALFEAAIAIGSSCAGSKTQLPATRSSNIHCTGQGSCGAGRSCNLCAGRRRTLRHDRHPLCRRSSTRNGPGPSDRRERGCFVRFAPLRRSRAGRGSARFRRARRIGMVERRGRHSSRRSGHRLLKVRRMKTKSEVGKPG